MRSKRKSVWPWLAVLGVGAWILVTVALLIGSGDENVPSSHGQPIGEMRTVLVSATGQPPVSQPGAPLHAGLVSGNLGTATTLATVLSDENCAPDAAGVSHCTNRLRMDDGSMMTVMHPHRMSNVPCLAPGERIRVQAA